MTENATTQTDDAAGGKEPVEKKPAGQKQQKGREHQIPSVGRAVHYIDREMALHAAHMNRQKEERGEEPNFPIEPYAATITRVHRDAAQQPTGNVTLEVHDPELGPQIKRDVPFAATYTAGCWSWPAYVAPR